MSRKMKRNCQQIMKLLLMLLLMTFVVFPFLVCLSHTFKYEGEINSLTPHLLPHLCQVGWRVGTSMWR